MTNKAMISVIIPVYNAAPYIHKCFNSVMNQSYKNIEILAIDDGSKDNSLEILRNISIYDNRLKVISQQNGGPSRARNNGIELASGEYIAFVDADDYLDNTYIEKMINQINGSDLVVCNYVEENGKGSIKNDIFNSIIRDKNIINEEIINEVVSKLGGLVWGKLFNKKIIDKYKIRFDEKFKMSEDLLFVLEFMNRANYIEKIDEYLYFHNKNNDESITYNYNSEMFFKQIEVQQKIENIFLETKYNKDNLKEMYRKRLKDIVMYSSYKEAIKNNKLKDKINNIKSYVTNEHIVSNCKEFDKNGIIDNLLVKSICIRNATMVYLLTKIRIIALDLYYKIKK